MNEASDTMLIERRLLSMSTIIMIGPIRFDTVSHEVEGNGKRLYLTPVENRILQFLATHSNTVCSAYQISLEGIGFDNCEGIGATNDGYITWRIHCIRQKIEPDPQNPVYLLTVPGVGYQLVLSF
jgi:DNA-binding response OmpR family regulator